MTNPRDSRKLYGGWAPFYDWTRVPFRWCSRQAHGALDRALLKAEGARILDLGCGTGFVANRLRSLLVAPRSLTLVDRAEPMLRRAGRLGSRVVSEDVIVHQDDALRFVRDPVESRRYEVIVSALLLAHIPEPEQLAFHAVRRLASDGTLCFLFFADDGRYGSRGLLRLFLRALGAVPVNAAGVEAALRAGAGGVGMAVDIDQQRSLAGGLVCLSARARSLPL